MSWRRYLDRFFEAFSTVAGGALALIIVVWVLLAVLEHVRIDKDTVEAVAMLLMAVGVFALLFDVRVVLHGR